MDLDPQPTIDDARPAATTVDPTSGPITGLARTYECTFCKRGFSNAQALGGHMNIHRKDRAKLKQTTSPAHFPFDISQRTTSYTPVLAPNTPWAGSKGPRQLPLFVEAPTMAPDERELGDNDHGPVELDLELRLGLQRPDSSATAIGLKESV